MQSPTVPRANCMKNRQSNFIVALLVALPLVSLSQGCYHRVVGVKGPAASQYDVYEPNLANDPPPSRTEDKQEKSQAKDEQTNKNWWWPF